MNNELDGLSQLLKGRQSMLNSPTFSTSVRKDFGLNVATDLQFSKGARIIASRHEVSKVVQRGEFEPQRFCK